MPKTKVACLRIANRVTELEIRRWLEINGFAGSRAKFDELELHAIKPPGWVQLYRCQVRVRRKDGAGEGAESGQDRLITHFGAVLSDERNPTGGLRVRLFVDQGEQRQQLEDWSEGMLIRRRGQVAGSVWIGLVVVLVMAILASINAFAAQFL